jgi:hypothetical protein
MRVDRACFKYNQNTPWYRCILVGRCNSLPLGTKTNDDAYCQVVAREILVLRRWWYKQVLL